MSFEITEAFVKQYSDTVLHLAQQSGSKLIGTVMVDTVRGQSKFYERVGAVSATQVTSRHADTPQADTPHSKRNLALTDYVWADLVDELDKVRTLISPENEYVKAGAMAMGRQIDQTIIDAINGSAYSGTAGTTAVVLPSAQKIAVASAGLTLAKLKTAKKKFDAANVPFEDRFLAISAEQVEDLLGVTQIISSDYNVIRTLVNGQVGSYLGFNIIPIELLNTDSNGDRSVLAWARPGIQLGIGAAPEADVGVRRDKSNATQVFFRMSIGATRKEEVQVVEIACSES